jgi:hypothetical protein
MSIVKRGATWHCHFVVDGIRYRQSLKTTDWREAQKKERDAIEKARAGKLAAKCKAIARLPFRQAAEQFVTDPARDLKPLSVRTEKRTHARSQQTARRLASKRAYSRAHTCLRSRASGAGHGARDRESGARHYSWSSEESEALASLRR